MFSRKFLFLSTLILASLMVFSVTPAAWAETGGTEKKAALDLGSDAPDFALPDVVTGETVRRDDFSDQKALLVIILCRHCPYVKHVLPDLAKFAKDYQGTGLGIVGVSANDPVAYPEDSPESLKQMALTEDLVFPVLFDGTQDIARAYGAVATPDFFLFDENRKLVYRGQYDDTRPKGKTPATGKDLRAAVDALLAGQLVPMDQKKAVGCSIKWKK